MVMPVGSGTGESWILIMPLPWCGLISCSSLGGELFSGLVGLLARAVPSGSLTSEGRVGMSMMSVGKSGGVKHLGSFPSALSTVLNCARGRLISAMCMLVLLSLGNVEFLQKQRAHLTIGSCLWTLAEGLPVLAWGWGATFGGLEDSHDGVMVVAVNVGRGGECQKEKEDKCDGVATNIDLVEVPFNVRQ